LKFTREKQPAQSKLPGKSKNLSYAFFEIAQTLIIALGLYFTIDAVIARVRVEKVSMEQTLAEGEILIVNKLAYKLGEIDHGDIITFHYPLQPELDYIKRVIGLPGDDVRMSNGEIYVNGYLLKESYLNNTSNDEGDWLVPENMIFVLGDNRKESSDSRNWGFVPIDDVIGKAIAIYWPPSHIRLLSHPDIINDTD